MHKDELETLIRMREIARWGTDDEFLRMYIGDQVARESSCPEYLKMHRMRHLVQEIRAAGPFCYRVINRKPDDAKIARLEKWCLGIRDDYIAKLDTKIERKKSLPQQVDPIEQKEREADSRFAALIAKIFG